MAELSLFSVSFIMVFALGFQSRNVNDGHYALAFTTNLIIGAMNLIVLRSVPAAGNWTLLAAYVAGGPFGIISAMYVHNRWVRKK